MQKKLSELAIARSGDKGPDSNIGLIAKSEPVFEFLRKELTEERVKDYFKEMCLGRVTRYELPNLWSLNFVLENSLSGGGTETLITDAQGKVHGLGLLQLELEIPDDLLN